MATPKLHLNLDDDALRELLFLARHGDKIGKVVDLAGEALETLDFDEAIDSVAEKVGLPAAEVDRLLQAVYNVTRIMLRLKIDAAQFLEAATRGFEDRRNVPFTEPDLQVWKAALDALRKAVTKIGPDHPFSIARKADRLTRAQQNIVYETKIITDLRPVFSTAGDAVLRSVITHRLLIDYFDGSSPARIELGLDSADLVELRKACERAEMKAVTLKESLKDIPWAASLGKGEQVR